MVPEGDGNIVAGRGFTIYILLRKKWSPKGTETVFGLSRSRYVPIEEEMVPEGDGNSNRGYAER